MAEISSTAVAILGGVVRISNTLAKNIKDFGNRLHTANENSTEWRNLANAYSVLVSALPDYETAIKGALSSDDFLSDLDRRTLEIYLNELQTIMNTATDKFTQMEKRFQESNLEHASRTSPHPAALSAGTGSISTHSQAQQNPIASNHLISCNLLKLCTNMCKRKEQTTTSTPLEKQTGSQNLENKRDVIIHANRDRETLTGLKENKKEAHVKLEEIRKLIDEKYGIFRKHFDRFQSTHFKDICINYNQNTHESKLKQAITNTNPEANPQSSSSKCVSVCVHGQGGMGKTTALRHICTAPGVKENYPDGIHFMTIGEDAQPQQIIKSISKCIENSGFGAVASKIREAEKVEEATRMGLSIFRDRRVLLIIDDWHPPHSKHLESFEGMLSESKNGVLLISTRYWTISEKCTEEVLFDPLSPTEPTAKSILLRHIFHIDDDLNPDAETALALDNILEICGGIKLLLAIGGRGIRAQKPKNASTAVRIKRYLERLISTESKHVSNKDDRTYEKSYKQVILTNLKYCDEEVDKHRIKWKIEGREVTIMKAEDLFKGFCVVEKQQRVPFDMICRLWRTKKIVTEEVLSKLEDCCLLTMYHEKRGNSTNDLEEQEEEVSIELHDSVIDTARCMTSEENSAESYPGAGPSSRSRWHEWLLGGYLCNLGGIDFEEESEETAESTGNPKKLSERICRPKWWNLETEEEYFVQNVTRHLKEGNMFNEYLGLLSNVEWTLKRIEIGGWAALESDFSNLEELGEIHRNERKKSHSGTTMQGVEVKGIRLLLTVLGTSWTRICEAPHSLGFEVFGRISNEDRKWKIVDRYMRSIEQWGLKPWLRPVTASLRKRDGREVNQIAVRGTVNNLCYTGEGKLTVIAVDLIEVFVYSDALKQEDPIIIRKSAGHGLICSTAFCSKTCYFACGLENGEIHIHDVTSGDLVGNTLKAHEDRVTCVALSNDGRLAVSGSWDKTVRVWDVETGEQVGHPMVGHEDRVDCVALSEDGQRVVSGSFDKTVRVWDVESGEQVGHPMTGHEDTVSCVVLSKDAQRVVSGSDDKTVRVWDVESGEQVGYSMSGHEGWVFCVLMSEDEQRVVSGSFDMTVRVWDVKSSEQVGQAVTGHEGAVACVAWSDDGRRVVSGSRDKTVRVWDVESSEQVGHPVTGHEQRVECVTLSDDGRRVVSGSWDKTVRVWDVESSEQVGHSMTGHEDGVKCVAMSEDGRRIVSGSFDETVRVWDVESNEQIGNSFHLPPNLGRGWEMEKTVDQIYNDWLQKLLDELMQHHTEQERRLFLLVLHQEVSKITNRCGHRFNLSLANFSSGCERKEWKGMANRYSLFVNRDCVLVGTARDRIVKIATLPAGYSFAQHEKTTVHGCVDGRVVICKLEDQLFDAKHLIAAMERERPVVLRRLDNPSAAGTSNSNL